MFAYAAGLLSIGLSKDWRLIHEDNGAFYTTVALSHLRLGLGETRAHDFLVERDAGRKIAYGHHPPGIGLILAGAFKLTGSDDPAVARGAAIVFHLGSLAIMVALVRSLLGFAAALWAGFFMATLPMGAFFGRMPGYEPFGLFAVMLQLFSWSRYRGTGSAKFLGFLFLGVILGGLIDWAPLFFSLGLFLFECRQLIRGRGHGPLVLVLGVSGIGIFALNIVHLYWAQGGSLETFLRVLGRNKIIAHSKFNIAEFALSQIERFRRYFSHAGLLAVLCSAWALTRPHSRVSRWLGMTAASDTWRALMAVSGLAALAYVCAAPKWAKVHHFWQFYFLPYTVCSLVFFWPALQQWINKKGRAQWWPLAALFWIELGASSAYTLYARHTRPSAYTLNAVGEFRANYLLPSSLSR